MPSEEPENQIPPNTAHFGHDAVPESPVLIGSNRLTAADVRAVQAILPGREWLFLTEEGRKIPGDVEAFLGRPGVESESFSTTGTSAELNAFEGRINEAVSQGKSLIFVPAQAVAHRASLMRAKPGPIKFLSQLDVALVPLYIEKPGELALSVEKKAGYCDTVYAFGETVAAGSGQRFPDFLQNLIHVREAAFSREPVLESNLAYLLLKGLVKHGSAAKVIDGLDGSELPFGRVLAASLALASHLKKETSRTRVGIVLPPGKGALIANLGVMFAGKIPVNLNFTASSEAVKSAMQQAELDRYITADKFISRTQRFPWPPLTETILLERLIPKLKKKAVTWGLLSKVLPVRALALAAGISTKGGDKEAVLLFTSGSSGEPKGVPLTHRNLIANVKQFGTRLDFGTDGSILGCLPLFHSLGCTVTLWFPVIEGHDLITYPSPLEVGKLADLIEKHSVKLLLATPTFLRGYLRKAKPEQLASVTLPIVGAEKLPVTVADNFKNRFGINVLEGYGLTETSPVTNVNLHDPQPVEDGDEVVPSYRLGSVGQLLPGVAVRITDPASGDLIPLDRTGMIWFKAANVFPGYLKMPRKTEEVMNEGWFCTGDIGRVDEDGFLYIEGRLSRFSKIGGEMVPHEKVEQAIIKILDGDQEDESVRRFAVAGIPDDKKGEALVLITTQAMNDQAMIELRYALLEQEIPALWIPRKAALVDEVPVLASGKLDIQACVTVALARAKGE